MARPLTIEDLRSHDVAEDGQGGWITQGTARAFAAALSALLIATFVISRSGEALETEGTTTASQVTSGTIELTDDDNGSSLFDLTDMVPGRASEQCITISYGGTIVPVDLTMKAEITGDLAPYLDVLIERGASGGFGHCDDFVTSGRVFDGTLAELARRDRLGLERFLNQGDSSTYRVRFALQDRQEALGRASSVGFVWEVKPA